MIDLSKFLLPISEESPCGLNPEENSEVQVIDVCLQDENWGDVKKNCYRLLGEHKDFRMAFLLTVSFLVRDGLPEFAAGLKMCDTMLKDYWGVLHPQPDEDGDVFDRLNVIDELAAPMGKMGDPVRVIEKLRQTTLVYSSEMRRGLTTREILLASGELTSINEDEAVLPAQLIDAVFEKADDKKTAENLKAVNLAKEALSGLKETIEDKTDESVNFTPLISELDKMLKNLLQAGEGAAATSGTEEVPVGEASAGSVAAVPVKRGISGELQSREDVVKLLGKIISFYEKTEPSSPVPLMLVRAQKMVGKSFRDLVMDITYSAKNDMDQIFGKEEDS